MVRVRAGTQIELQSAQSEGSLDLHGALTDDLGAPLASQRVVVAIRPQASAGQAVVRTLRTAEDGRFSSLFALPLGRYDAQLRFDGDGHFDAAELKRALDVGLADVRLRFVAPRETLMPLERAAHVIEVQAICAVGAGGLGIVVRDETGRKLAHGETTGSGLFRVELPSSALGAAGAGRLIAESSADASRAPARAELSVIRYERTTLDLVASLLANTDRIAMHGTLRGARAGLPHKAIGLFLGTQHLATVLTADGGAFRAEAAIVGKEAARSPLRLQARFESDGAWVGSSRSPVVALSLAPEREPSTAWLLAPLAVSALALVVLSRRRALTTPRPPTVAIERGVGIHPSGQRPRGRTEISVVSGSVLDALDGRPIPSALVVLSTAGQQHEQRSDAAGRFASADLPAGTYELSVRAPGYGVIHGTLVVPHRGLWSGVEIRLESLRDAALRAYRPAALLKLPSPSLWGLWTPRETLAHTERRGASTESFVQLTAKVEQAAYAERAPTEREVADITSASHTEAQRMTDPS